MKKIIYYLIIIQLLGVMYAQAQNRTVSGRILDSAGQAISGASVVEKGNVKNGTVSNDDGSFTIILKGTSNRILINAIGFVTQDLAAQNGTMRINLKADEAKGMEDVVVVGFGRQKKITSTGAISSISGKEIRNNPSASMQNTLAGRLPGFFSQQTSGRPGADGAAFYIRGVSSYNGNNQPLIIVDDIEFPYEQFQRLDPNEVESISILKDASTTAVYGVRGANGVVVVTTRRGQVGTPQINFRGETTLSQPTRIQNFLNAYESASLYNQARKNDGLTPMFTDADLAAYRDHTDPYGHPDIDWKDVLFKKFAQQYRGNFDISGGTDRIKYFISAGYLNQGGILKNYSKGTDLNSNYYHQRYNYRSNLDIKVTKTTDFRVDLYGNIGQINVPNVGSPFGYNDVFYEYSSFLSLAPFAYPIYNPNGTYGYSVWQRSNSNYNTNNIVGRLTLYGYNRTFENNMNVISSVNQKLDFITKGLSFKTTVSYASSYGYSRGMTRDQFPSFIYNAAAGTYEARDANIYRVRRLFIGYGAGSTVRNVSFQAILNYDRTFAGRHHIYGLGLFSQNSATASNSNATYNFVPTNFRGFTGRVGYDYKQKYLVEFNAGYNGSDRFAKAKRFGFLPAASAGWNIAEEKFFKDNVKFVNRLKIRGSYGLVGNDKLGNGFSYFYQQQYNFSGTTYFGPQSSGGVSGISEGTLGNPEVTWEKERKLDVGLEFVLFKNKVIGSVEYFDNNRYDILTTRGTVSQVFGQALPPVNLGKTNNHGYEVELGYADNITKDLSFTVKGSYSFARNKIVFQDEASYQFPYQAYTGNSIGMQRVYTWIGYYKDADDIAQSPKPAVAVRPGDLKYADLNGDGLINAFDMKVQGFPNVPNTTAGLQLGFRFKDVSIGAFFQGSKNFNVRGVREAIRAFSANPSYIHTQAWTPELGDNAKFPLLTLSPGVSDADAYPSTFWFIKGDFIRLKTAEINYSLPQKWVKSIGMKDIRLYANGLNLVTWSKLNKLYEFDPEITTNTDRVNYPPQRSYNFGISASF